ncbi:hypothetical protein AX774_g1302 [Zancudomyces culisetae]|uniref:Uncharacterized protein n=1 Tax=Zancudomyces culisetae TaxID=1213189 RepID=A0A1R1PW41_ZANCU|nr:hypothetical protein AX774_g1302 [Zancudomyces culisetae]|eukprot:OMH85159.1 hypothetical protein AX774_g1302 [Zancudomyces culisetae]
MSMVCYILQHYLFILRNHNATSPRLYFYFHFLIIAFNSSGPNSAFTIALFVILLARVPNRSVLTVSAALYDDGEQLIISVVLLFPPNDSCNIRVSLLSRYGICDDLPSVSALITIPSADNDLFIFLASSNVCPDAPVFPTFSDPAKSTKLNLPIFVLPSTVFF